MRTILVEKHPIVSLGLKTAIEAEEDMEVVNTCSDIKEAWLHTKELRPDLIVTELVLAAGSCGLELCEKVKALPEPPAVLLYTGLNSTEDLAACRSSSADGYVHKGECRTNLIQAIRSLYAGREQWFIGDNLEQSGTRGFLDYNALTSREREVLGLLEKRQTDREIADRLCISYETARSHAKNILTKLRLESRRQIS